MCGVDVFFGVLLLFLEKPIIRKYPEILFWLCDKFHFQFIHSSPIKHHSKNQHFSQHIMPGSQLKRLKASLKSAGVIGQPQQSKKAKKQQKQGSNGTTNSDSRLTKETALQSIREEFNPFEIKKNREKYSTSGGKKVKGIVGRPGISKQAGEEIVRRCSMDELR